MDLARIRLFLDIVDSKNLSFTAQRFGYTQSGVSHSLSKLENELGVTLFTRTKHGVELTSDAEFLVPYARNLMIQEKNFMEAAHSLQGIQCGSLTIATYASVAARWLPQIITTFQRQYPNVSYSIREGGMEDIESWIMNGEVDFGFLSWRKDSPIKFKAIAKDPLVAVMKRNHPLPPSYFETFPIYGFMDFPFIASPGAVDYDIHSAFIDSGIVPMTTYVCNEPSTTISMVKSGLGISLLPKMVVEKHKDEICMVRTTPSYTRTLGVGFHPKRSLSLASKEFIRMASDLIPTLV